MGGPAELLMRIAMFRELAQLHRDQIAQHLTRHEYPADTDIVRQGQPADALYLIEAGSIGVFRRDPQIGLVRMIGQIDAPDAFGEMALVTGAPRSSTCTTLEPTVVHRLSRELFDAVVQQAPNVAMGVARSVAQRLERLNQEFEVPWVSLVDRQIDPRLCALLPGDVLWQNRIIPLSLEGKTLTVGMVDPTNTTALDPFRQAIVGVQFRVVAVSTKDYETVIKGLLGQDPARLRGEVQPPAQRPQLTFVEDEDSSRGQGAAVSGPQVQAITDELIGTGLAVGASDIHVERQRSGVVVRYRIEGELRAHGKTLPNELAKPLFSRLKLLAKLDITETRKPQDGRITVKTNQRYVDLRVSSIPTKLGEKIVMRILDPSANLTDLRHLFAADKLRQLFREMVFRPHGLVLVTGPTGSGKTTTLYSGLATRLRPELNIVTVEDPVEYHMDGVTQIQVRPESGATFARILRALLRQDPDVILVGETRDAETADVAVEAAMTGHLVLTSVHTNSALDAVLRLVDLGVERYALANALVGVVHQRLVRRLCAKCATPFTYPEPIVKRLYEAGALRQQDQPTLYRGTGCDACNKTGFRGRIGVFELLVVNDAVRNAIASGADQAKLREIAMAGAMVDLPRYGGILLGGGVTAPGEILPLIRTIGS